MVNSRLFASASIIASLMLLTACGGGGGSFPEDDVPSIPPINGMSWAQTQKLDVGEGDEREFDFVNFVDANADGANDHRGGFIQFIAGFLGDDDRIHNAKVAMVFRRGGTEQTRTDMRYHEGYHAASPGQRIVVEEVDTDGVTANGHEFLLARHQTLLADGWSTESYIYLPAEGGDKSYVGLAALASEESGTSETRLGIFGDRTSRSELQPQRGLATYEGFGRAYVSSSDWTIHYGEYSGPVTASVDFGTDVMGGTFTSDGALTSSVDPTRRMNYSVGGRFGGDGQLVATRATVGEDRQVAVSILDVGGAMFGPEANSMGYVYTLDGEGVGTMDDSYFRMTGGAILDRD